MSATSFFVKMGGWPVSKGVKRGNWRGKGGTDAIESQRSGGGGGEFNWSVRGGSRMAASASEEGEQGPLIAERPFIAKQERVVTRPYHLIVLVNGIFSSGNDWTYGGKQLKKRLGNSVLVHPSASNSWFLTLQGIDVAGERLAEEIHGIIDRTPGLTKISFVAHSLGGLFVRYAIGRLYTCSSCLGKGNSKGTLAGLEPVNLVTLATPHLGVRGNKQLPFLLGLTAMEKLAAPMASFIVGRTGKHLFLNDDDKDIPPLPATSPLLVRMSKDCGDGYAFISALKLFKQRVLYANVGYDHMVGWRTSSIRREEELPKVPRRSLSERYRHVVRMEECPAIEPANPHVPATSMESLSSSSSSSSSSSTAAGSGVSGALKSVPPKSRSSAADWEEEMITGLQQVAWRKVDVNFEGAYFPFMAHNFIHVKMAWIHFEGAGVNKHFVDLFLEQEDKVTLEASL